MEGVVGWFQQRGEIPLLPAPKVREYCPLTDDPDRTLDAHFSSAIAGVAFAIEYCDSHGWMSSRTVRCLELDPRHPAWLRAYCRVRDRIMGFRVDRIISIVDLRSGRVVSGDEHLALLAPYLPPEQPGRDLRSLIQLQRAARDGVFALLQLAMRDGRLSDEARGIVIGYAMAEAAANECYGAREDLAALWIDNLAPTLDSVAASVGALLTDKEKFARLLPPLLKVARCGGSSAPTEEALRELIAAVRRHFRRTPRDFPSNLRASR